MAWPLSLFSCSDDAEQPAASSSKPPKAPPSAVQSPLLALLQHFESPGVSLPPSNRVGDPKLKQRVIEPPGLLDLWKWGAFAAVKGVYFIARCPTSANCLVSISATHVASAVVSHAVYGPPKKSWGIEMSVLCSLMRDTSRHSHLTDVVCNHVVTTHWMFRPLLLYLQTTLRLLMSIGGLVPVPSDAIVTPVTFRVRRRHLRGILAGFDAVEDGSRELSGEWIVGKRTWQRLQHEWKASKKAKAKGHVSHCDPKAHSSKRKERVDGKSA